MATERQQVQCPVRADFDPLDLAFLEDPYAVPAGLPVEKEPVFYAGWSRGARCRSIRTSRSAGRCSSGCRTDAAR